MASDLRYAIRSLAKTPSFTAVVRRTREMGVRIALGATPRDVRSLVVREGVLVGAAGVATGLALAFPASAAVADMLFGVKPVDALTFLAAGAVLLAVSAVASYIPARRAVRVDPLVALRSE